ncbi:MAG: RES domain-containing protein [Proteobacteria bacterium]|nr:MAG: RES domain-containing protein [Pseudomonadota bacterium]
MDIWAACRDAAHPGPLSGTLVRAVESQQQVATTTLVDTPAEQQLLEELLEASKPPRPPGFEALHYLLATPFRYPPLRHGSRFGARHEPSLFYGATRRRTALAETAYYRLVFLDGMAEPPPSPALVTQHTVFRARYRTRHGLRLQNPPFSRYEARLRDPSRYDDTQVLGARLRNAGITAFQYRSARHSGGGINVALFSPTALADTRPNALEPLTCVTRFDAVTFHGAGDDSLHFDRSMYLVNGLLPQPAV